MSNTIKALPLIIDCDPGQDDAIALMLAMASPEELDLLGICAVAGNVPLVLTEANARRIRDVSGRPQIPVFAGCPRPMVKILETAEYVHGKSGIDGAGLPDPSRPVEAAHAVDWLIDTLRHADNPITVATLGPLTNIAMAIVMAPDIIENISELILMGGALSLGNISPAAEFNIYSDPHAAHIVFEAGIKLTMIGLDVTHQARATPERLKAIRAINNPAAICVAGMLDFYSAQYIETFGEGAPLHDPCVIAYILRPDLFTGQEMRVDIEISSPLTIGRTVCDQHARSGRAANANVLEKIDADGFFALLGERLARLPKAG
ncbi:MAG: nucleoside hydrolase [Proteobacteria bacterium]|nr:nucleoside hydrolase [Pseudomonadota bacterium]MDA1355043.1 nucleoside hydrolase [Pseudomonadota bacterium]